MADAASPLYGLVLPEVGASADVWGSKLNNDFNDLDALSGAMTCGGAASAYTLTTGLSLAAYVSNQRFLVKWNHTNGGSATLAVDGLAAKTIKKRDATTNCAASDLVSGAFAFVVYDGTNFVLLTPVASDFQASDATLTALAGLTTAASQYIRATGADAFTMDSYATVLNNIGAGSLANANTWASDQVFTGDIRINGGQIFFGGTTAYINNSGADQLDIVTNNSTRVRVDSAGLVTLFGSLTGAGAIQYRVATSLETSGTLTAASANTHLALSGDVTLNNSVFSANDKQTYDPGTSNRTFTRGSGVTMYVNGTNSATATLAANQMGGSHWRSASVVVLTGAFS